MAERQNQNRGQACGLCDSLVDSAGGSRASAPEGTMIENRTNRRPDRSCRSTGLQLKVIRPRSNAINS